MKTTASSAATMAAGQKPLDGSWPENPVVGPLTGREWSHLMHKHLDHHLRQFSS